jgi:hypothetical protein
MSVALLVATGDEAERRIVPVATQELFRARWLPGAAQLGLEWIERMETGFDVTVDNRDAVVDELTRLRMWMVGALGGDSYDVERRDRLVDALRGPRFGDGRCAFLG